MFRYFRAAIGLSLASLGALPFMISFAMAQSADTSSTDVQSTDVQSTDTQSTEIAIPEDYQVILGDRWSFAVPSDWQNTLPSPTTVGNVSLVAQLNDTQRQVVVNLVTEPYEGDGENYIQTNLQGLQSSGFTIHQQQSITFGNLQGVELDVSLPSVDPALPLRLLQRMLTGAGVGYTMTCGGTEANFEATSAICTTILDTFQVTSQ